MPFDPRKRLADARLYLCTDSRRRHGDLAEFLDAVLGAGVEIVQLREKGLEARAEIALLEVFATAAERHSALYAVNDRADVAAAVAAPILHLGQGDLPPDVARRLVGTDTLIGLSSHDARQANAAATAANVDYFCAGPVWSTPTKPGRPAAGLEVVSAAAQAAPADAPDSRPWFAIGGIDLTSLDDVLAQGAHRVVVVRAITEAEDPAFATAAFVERLHAAG